MKKVLFAVLMLGYVFVATSGKMDINSYSSELELIKADVTNRVNAIASWQAGAVCTQIYQNSVAFDDLYNKIQEMTSEDALPLVADRLDSLAMTYEKLGGSMINTIISKQTTELNGIIASTNKCKSLVSQVTSEIEALTSKINALNDKISLETDATQKTIYQNEVKSLESIVNSKSLIKKTLEKVSDFLQNLVEKVQENINQTKILLNCLKNNALVLREGADAARVFKVVNKMSEELAQLVDLSGYINDMTGNWIKLDAILLDLSNISV